MTPTTTTADRVRQVIEDSGLSQADFAAKAGLDGPKMSKSLSGSRRFTSLDLARIADVAGVTVDWLLGVEQPSALAARAIAPSWSSTDAAVGQARHYSQLRADLAFLGYEQRVPQLPAPTQQRAIDRGARLADLAVTLVRQATGRDPAGFRKIAELIEDAFDIDVAVAAMPNGFDGLAWRDVHSQLILVGTSEIPARQRFTVAHELGHLLARDDQELHIDADLHDAEHTKKPSELQANAFAASFLMPADTLGKMVRDDAALTEEAFAALAHKLAVSPSTLAWRLQNLGIIGTKTRKAFMRMPAVRAAQTSGAAGDFAEWIGEASRVRVPSGLLRHTWQAYCDGKATLRPFATLISVDTATLHAAIDEAAAERSPLAS